MANKQEMAQARELLNEALASDVGIRANIIQPGVLVPTLKAKQVLYETKEENSDYNCLKIEFDPDDPNNYLWLIKLPE